MLKKGLCGGDLKQQVTVIALTYCVRKCFIIEYVPFLICWL